MELNEPPRPAVIPDRIDAVTFDCYGTLVDWERGILDALRSLLPRDIATDDEVLRAFARAEAAAESGAYRPYAEVLLVVEEAVRCAFGIDSRATGLLRESLPTWPAFEDSAAAINDLRRHCRVGVISNIDDALFEAHMRNAGIVVDFVVTAQSCGSYKPAALNFLEARSRHGLGNAWIHAAESLYHDVRPCNSLGIPCVWIHRRHAQPGFGATAGAEAVPSARVTSVRALVDLLSPRLAGRTGE